MDGDNSLEDLDRQVEEVSSYHQEHNSKNLNSLGEQVKRGEQDKDNGVSSSGFLNGKFCCQLTAELPQMIVYCGA